MRRLAVVAFMVALAVPATAMAGSDHQQLKHRLHVLHQVLGSSCAKSHAAPLGYRAVCSKGRVAKLTSPDRSTTLTERVDDYTIHRPVKGTQRQVHVAGSARTIRRSSSVATKHRGLLLIVSSMLRKAEPTLHTAVVPPARCDDNRGRLEAGIVHGIPFHTWFFKVNLGQVSIMTWRSGNVFAIGEPGRMVFEIGAAFGDWMGSRNPSPGSASGRYPAQLPYYGCSLAWPQQQNPNSDPNQNPGRVNFSYQGDTALPASMEPGCHGGSNTGTDGVSVVTVRNWTCDSFAYAETSLAVNVSGYTTETDISFNNAIYGSNTSWCYRFTNGCISQAWLSGGEGAFTTPVEDVSRHELGHVLGLDHSCGNLNCTHNTMDVDYDPRTEWPLDLGQGDRNNEVYLYTVN